MIYFEALETEDARNLIRLLDEELLRRYPAMTDVHGLHAEDLADPDFAFAVVRIDGRAVGCGALRSLEPGTSEIKRMFVLPEFRGCGIARQILAVLESRARELGRERVRLETGIGQPEAIGLYRSAGYREIESFGEYASNSFSVCFEKRFAERPAGPLEPVTIRKASVDDAKPVADVLNSVIAEGGQTLFERPFSEEEERRFIAALSSRSCLHVAVTGGEIVGVQSVDLFTDVAASLQHVATIGTWLRSSVRGRGIGRLLAEESFRFAREQGYRKFVIQVLAENERALRFYRSLGFRDIGVAKDHVLLSGKFHDEVYMEKSLPP